MRKIRNIYVILFLLSVYHATSQELVPITKTQVLSKVSEDNMSIKISEQEHLYIEYDPISFNLDSFKEILTAVRFPLEHEKIKLVSLN
ncbi:hypothetical protein [Lutibacter sp. B1]|uniref:hypothetical protein n=1 Tax=Lutibacter sp. B1 TaxID=2725996 RepID=UPI001457251B|nr:hypothetical protein [Lutibacter sp. B1]NLP58995.1 hypothetical protein [Lutibacter sp. B1]